MTTDRPKTLNFITGNANKLAEIRAILGDVVTIESAALDIDEIQGSIEQIATDKARRAATLVNGSVLTEDTALCFTALNGLPGPYIKYFLEGIGLEGLNNLLLAYPDKSATAICTFAYCHSPTSSPMLFQGLTTGTIVPARGPNTFGWDPIFQYNDQTYAEMDKTRKVGDDVTYVLNEVSHRSKALAKLKTWLVEEEAEASS